MLRTSFMTHPATMRVLIAQMFPGNCDWSQGCARCSQTPVIAHRITCEKAQYKSSCHRSKKSLHNVLTDALVGYAAVLGF
jgi:hypothetical protein